MLDLLMFAPGTLVFLYATVGELRRRHEVRTRIMRGLDAGEELACALAWERHVRRAPRLERRDVTAA